MSSPIFSSINNYNDGSKDFTFKGQPVRKRLFDLTESEETSGDEKRRKVEKVVFQGSVFTSPSVQQPRHSNLSSSPLAANFRILSPLSFNQSNEEEGHVFSNSDKAELVGTTPNSPNPPSFMSPFSSAKVSSTAFGSPVFASPPSRGALKLVCPSAPRKSFMSSRPIQEVPLFFQNAVRYKDSLDDALAEDPRILGKFVAHGRLNAELGEGDFCRAYAVRFQANEQTEEEVQVVKIHKLLEHVRSPDQLIGCLLSEIEQYVFLKDKGFPVAKFFNFDEFLALGNNFAFYKDAGQSEAVLKQHLKANFLHPFYRVEYVPFSIADTKDELESYYESEVAISKGDLRVRLEEQNDPLYQVKKMFEFAWENGVCLDLGLGNLRIREDKTVVLIDLYYDREEEFSAHFIKCLHTFSHELRSPVVDYLISGLPDSAKALLANERKRLKISRSRS